MAKSVYISHSAGLIQFHVQVTIPPLFSESRRREKREILAATQRVSQKLRFLRTRVPTFYCGDRTRIPPRQICIGTLRV